ncbi:hypothetical protein PF672P2_00052 [Parabacteroides phage PF672P2]|nr:hypothetical protein PF672P2_00052 [Parabacteroides phage PF672P2]
MKKLIILLAGIIGVFISLLTLSFWRFVLGLSLICIACFCYGKKN